MKESEKLMLISKGLSYEKSSKSQVISAGRSLNDIAKRVEIMERWIVQEGERSNTCTYDILKEICPNCRCGKNGNP